MQKPSNIVGFLYFKNMANSKRSTGTFQQAQYLLFLIFNTALYIPLSEYYFQPWFLEGIYNVCVRDKKNNLDSMHFKLQNQHN